MIKKKRTPIYFDISNKKLLLLLPAVALITSLLSISIPTMMIYPKIALWTPIVCTSLALLFSWASYFYRRTIMVMLYGGIFNLLSCPLWPLATAFFCLCFYPFQWWKVMLFTLITLLIAIFTVIEIKRIDHKAVAKINRRKKSIRLRNSKYYYSMTSISEAIYSMRKQ